MGWNQESITRLFQKQNSKTNIEIVKAVDDNSKYLDKVSDNYLYSIVPYHIENINGNLYNLKLLGKMFTSSTVKNTFLNIQLLANDGETFKKSKYYTTNIDNLTLHNVYRKLYGKETLENSYRIDLCIKYEKTDAGFYQMNLVNSITNEVSICYLSEEYFFKIAIFQWYLLAFGIIDGDILVSKFTKFNNIAVDKEKTFDEFRLLSMGSKAEVFVFYWNTYIIVATINQDRSTEIDYLMLTKEEYKEYTDRFIEKKATIMRVGESAT